jgi:hypothetical protein
MSNFSCEFQSKSRFARAARRPSGTGVMRQAPTLYERTEAIGGFVGGADGLHVI